ncbi:MAG: porin family protein [Nitrospinae bacterium]|nr:porin family protein [Nitrospinota bacterium]
MKRLIVVAVLALVFITTSAHAADKGMYVSGNLGVSLAADSNFRASGVDIGEISFDTGFNIGGALGYDYGEFRAEFEIAYHFWDMDELTISGILPGCPCTGPVDGDASALSFMVNGYYDFPVENSPVSPYLGGGIGGAIVTWDITGLVDDSDLAFAYQIMAGIGFEINPSTTLTVGYRFFLTEDPEVQIFGTDVEFTVESHEFNVGARFMF